MIDVIMTTYNRVDFLKIAVQSLFDLNKTVPYRMIIFDDCSPDGTPDYLKNLRHDNLQAVILSKKRMGVSYGFNQAWNFAEEMCAFHSDFPFLCYLQDDLESIEAEWLLTLMQAYEELGEEHAVGFLSGHDATEHPIFKEIAWNGHRALLKKSQGATNLMAPKAFWRSIGFVPRLNPNGTERGFPGGGVGSHIDLYLTGCMSGSRFIREAAAKNCLFSQQKTLLVVPGLLRHMGQNPSVSTWRDKRR